MSSRCCVVRGDLVREDIVEVRERDIDVSKVLLFKIYPPAVCWVRETHCR